MRNTWNPSQGSTLESGKPDKRPLLHGIRFDFNLIAVGQWPQLLHQITAAKVVVEIIVKCSPFAGFPYIINRNGELLLDNPTLKVGPIAQLRGRRQARRQQNDDRTTRLLELLDDRGSGLREGEEDRTTREDDGG
jgi:hypothetical protein